jgi:hypothetical protein
MEISITCRQLKKALMQAWKEGFKIDSSQTENLEGRAEAAAQQIVMWMLEQDDYKRNQT